MQKKRQRPAFVDCVNCGRTMSVAEYQGVPTDGFDRSFIKTVFDEVLAGTSVQCTKCGYYTIFKDPSEVNASR
ncbi:hypothetical protein [Burkholderia ubonensis]|uniref:hypothetical protein n=1 Tax=Burkholderia ubonensis TaxID=101571 RepID=UPI000A941D07|nr:hypothetical protein [Burkholderia ubonensis]